MALWVGEGFFPLTSRSGPGFWGKGGAQLEGAGENGMLGISSGMIVCLHG